MDEWKPMSEAAAEAGLSRNTLARWVKAGRLPTRTKKVRNLTATLVSVAAVKGLVGDGVPRGRPVKPAAGDRATKLAKRLRASSGDKGR